MHQRLFARRTGKPTSWLVCLLACVMFTGCQKKAPPPAAAKPPEVFFVTPVTESVTQHEEFSGRTTSSNTVELLARVSGYLKKVKFEDGADVKAEQVLFEIDDATYQATLAQADAAIKQAQAHLENLQSQLTRAEKLYKTKTITLEQLENLQFQTREAEATKVAAEAARDLADINVKFTKVLAPINGHISRRVVDEGNLVKADSTVLATIVAPTPIYGYFDFDERTLLTMRRLVEQGKLKAAPNLEADVHVALAGEEDFTLKGKINWVDNQIDPGTGTLRARVSIDNPKHLLSPGMFVRLKVPVGPKEEVLLIPEEALGSDQGLRYVYLITKNDKDEDAIEYRRVDVGWITEGRRVIRSGLKSGDRVVVTGLQRVRPKMVVDAKQFVKATEASPAPVKDQSPAETTGTKTTSTDKPKTVDSPVASKK